MELAAMIQQAQDAAPTGDAYLDSAKGRLAYRVTAPDNFDPNRFVNCTANDIVVMRYGLGAYNVLPGCGYDYLEIEWYNGHFQPYRVYGLFSVNLSLNLSRSIASKTSSRRSYGMSATTSLSALPTSWTNCPLAI